jgi:hypothetical protein
MLTKIIFMSGHYKISVTQLSNSEIYMCVCVCEKERESECPVINPKTCLRF